MAFLVLGIVLRLVRYLQLFPLWCDETMLAANLLDRKWPDLAQPLAYRQVCPLGFLVLEWAVVRLLGFSEPVLRLIPVLCAMASVPLLHRLARRLLGTATPATLLTVALFAVAEGPIRFAAEVKPYATDLLVSLVLLNLMVGWRDDRERRRGFWFLAGVAPLAIGLSLPSVFLIGAIAIVGLWELLRRRAAGALLAYGGFLASAGIAVTTMAAIGQYQSSPGDRTYFLKFWAAGFPPSLSDPGSLVGWLIRAHTGPMFALFPVGGYGQAWLSASFFGSFIVGAVALSRRERGGAPLLVLPFLMTLLAAMLRRYPYGMSVRVTQYLVPATILLAAAGLAWVGDRVRPPSRAGWFAPGLAASLLAVGVWGVGCDLVQPYRAPWDRTSREFARWFWQELDTEAVLVCVQTDLGIPFRSRPWAYDGADQYLCLQRIYSPRHRQARPPRWESISSTRPLYCVLLNRKPDEVPGFQKWIDAHRDRYTLRDVRTYRASGGSTLEPALNYVVCEFRPSPSRVAKAAVSSTPR
jgi:hypothetical protein